MHHPPAQIQIGRMDLFRLLGLSAAPPPPPPPKPEESWPLMLRLALNSSIEPRDVAIKTGIHLVIMGLVWAAFMWGFAPR